MEGEREELVPQKRAAPLSTVSLDSTYDHDDGIAQKSPLHKQYSWTLLAVLAGIVLVAVGLVLSLDRGDPGHHGVVVDVAEGAPFVSTHLALMTGQSLTGPQNKLVAWLKQISNASALSIEGGSNNMSVSGLLFPRNDTATWLPFDAALSIETGEAIPTRQIVALLNGRGYKWAVTSLGFGDAITTSGCLTANRTGDFNELGAVLPTATWGSDDPDDKSEVNVEFGGANYTVSEDDYDYNSDSPRCWLVESSEGDFGLRACIPVLRQQFAPEADFAELFSRTGDCPQLVPVTGLAGVKLAVVPMPLRKWYASYKS
ncbi:unnamed protein product [Phytophthora fragariaefolia]|uniref:Unnamed protein product n=1 Tax=Phytophthora fragariaefolia TaxID=1490495 RepID=A0A9W6XIA4_9STRA|nr:unnamed protein product [Phytophthora fragariaefolia]